jgi:hypothetical protein
VTNILSAISGHFSKSLILGTFLPVVVFIILTLFLASPLLPADWSFLNHLIAVESLSAQTVIIFSLAAILLSGLLYNLNIPLIRFYEGYPWKDSLVGKWRTEHYQEQFDTACAQRSGMRIVLDRLLATGSDDKRLSDFRVNFRRISQRVSYTFPNSRSSVLPTRLGNVIRNFEDYPDRQYGMGAITLWPRLIAKIDKEYATVISDSKTSFDFMLNCSVLSAIAASLILVAGLGYAAPTLTGWVLALWLLKICVFAVLSGLMYVWAIGRASAWGAEVKGAFDLYRWELLKQLGYDRTPTSVADERALWDKISIFMLYGDPPKGRARLDDYRSQTAFVRGDPHTVMLDLIRGVSSPESDGRVKITLRISNVDAMKRVAKNVAVTDTLPEGFDYLWGSAIVDTGTLYLVGANPYRFEIGEIQPETEKTLTYLALPRKKP